MGLRELQHSHIVFWVLATFAVIGFILSIFFFAAYWYDRPSREINYFHHTSSVIDAETLGKNTLAINGIPFTNGTLSLNRLYIWNGGNQKITIDEITEPLQVHIDSWDAVPTHLDVTYHNIVPDQIEGGMLTGFRFKSLYPKSGIVVKFFTTIDGEVGLTGFVSGAGENNGIVKRERSDFPLLSLGMLVIWCTIFLIIYIVFWKRDRFKTWPERFIGLIISGGISYGPAMIILIIIQEWFNADLPPF